MRVFWGHGTRSQAIVIVVVGAGAGAGTTTTTIIIIIFMVIPMINCWVFRVNGQAVLLPRSVKQCASGKSGV